MNAVEQIRNDSDVLTAFGVKHIWLFGSVARGAPNPRDVDLLVEFERPPDLLNYMGLKFRLEEILGKPVDLLSKSACRPRFYREIEGELVDVA